MAAEVFFEVRAYSASGHARAADYRARNCSPTASWAVAEVEKARRTLNKFIFIDVIFYDVMFVIYNYFLLISGKVLFGKFIKIDIIWLISKENYLKGAITVFDKNLSL